jgi:1,2-diacylglycerol 3-beta-glucosyltransferase
MCEVPPQEPLISHGVGKTLLIVEDDILAAVALRDELADCGYHVLDLTERHEEALLAARRGKPDLALVDIQLAGNDDGVALALDFKAIGVPTLFISGQICRARAAHAAAIGSMPKPYNASDMVQAVDYLFARLRGEPAPTPPRGLEVFNANDQISRDAGFRQGEIERQGWR